MTTDPVTFDCSMESLQDALRHLREKLSCLETKTVAAEEYGRRTDDPGPKLERETTMLRETIALVERELSKFIAAEESEDCAA